MARQLPGERSYHVFYQLCSGADPELREKLGLKDAAEFRSLVRFFLEGGVLERESCRCKSYV